MWQVVRVVVCQAAQGIDVVQLGSRHPIVRVGHEVANLGLHLQGAWSWGNLVEYEMVQRIL